MEVAEMADKEKKWSVDWRTFDWKAVDKEIEEKKPGSAEKVTAITRELFAEYLQWLKETQPELLDIVGAMYMLYMEGAPAEALDKLKKQWDELTGKEK
jgi:hypothetical protein